MTTKKTTIRLEDHEVKNLLLVLTSLAEKGGDAGMLTKEFVLPSIMRSVDK